MLLAPLIATAATQSAGPTAADLSAAFRRHGEWTPTSGQSIRRVQCKQFEEEPTEFHCQFRARSNGGAWRKHKAIVTYDKGWLLLDFE